MIALNWCTWWALTSAYISPPTRYVDNPYEPIPERPTTKIARASFISKCYPGRVDFLRSLPILSPPFPNVYSLKSTSLQLPTGDLVTKVFPLPLLLLSPSKVSGSSFTWDGVTWHTATYAARNKVLFDTFQTMSIWLSYFWKFLPLKEILSSENNEKHIGHLTVVCTLHKFTWLSFDGFPLSTGGGAKLSAKCSTLFWTHGRLFCALVIWEEKVGQTKSILVGNNTWQEVSTSFYVSYGDEDEGILYGVLWLGDQAVILQTCGKVREATDNYQLLQDCAMWCDLKEERMWEMDGWVNGWEVDFRQACSSQIQYLSNKQTNTETAMLSSGLGD